MGVFKRTVLTAVAAAGPAAGAMAGINGDTEAFASLRMTDV
jgi:hypothetical protein